MNILSLEKIDHNNPNFDELRRMILDLENFLNEDIKFNDENWNNNFNIIIDFQDADGSFKLVDSFKIPSDSCIHYCYIPTYICTAILMKAFISDSEAFSSKAKNTLLNGLKRSCAVNLCGQGFNALNGQIKALNIFMKSGLKEFMDLHREFCPEFIEMINNISSKFYKMETEGKFLGPMKESYEKDIIAINEYFTNRNVFVYGTLMSDECNHKYLSNSAYLGQGTIEGYEMYNVGWFPAIIEGGNLIIGELYQVPINDLPAIDHLEGEGTFYLKKCETVKDTEGKTSFAYIYVYLEDVSNLERISAWKEEYVWYVSYGSNMLKERLLCYIQGGPFRGSKYRQPCEDTSLPLLVKPFKVPYDMYFGNTSASWEEGGVSFLDISKPGNAFGVAYLITKKQFEHIVVQENSGRPPKEGYGWYENIINLGMMKGFNVLTITNNNLRPYNTPCDTYSDILHEGIKENWPDISDEDIEDYIYDCIR
ncbi:gamma-glutamylcyclotransferase [uncultured Methanobrevibacter sp.]|uniref:gamma-glutamylcyclotransferase family protein n=1 Tax=uncultured Methanobrevibacter sp. TaxID=253161 RepID=UPI0025E59732|nr:gamma-glutamylcyclotransferase family protein [uncultured Methanobrevibacter sp.]